MVLAPNFICHVFFGWGNNAVCLWEIFFHSGFHHQWLSRIIWGLFMKFSANWYAIILLLHCQMWLKFPLHPSHLQISFAIVFQHPLIVKCPSVCVISCAQWSHWCGRWYDLIWRWSSSEDQCLLLKQQYHSNVLDQLIFENWLLHFESFRASFCKTKFKKIITAYVLMNVNFHCLNPLNTADVYSLKGFHSAHTWRYWLQT